MKENEDVTLDYSPDSLRHFDNFLKMFQKNGISVEQIPKIVFQVGCHSG